MLTADFVRLRKKGDHHVLEGVSDAAMQDVRAYADRIVGIGLGALGQTRAEVEGLRARAAEGVSFRNKAFFDGLAIVFDDAATFEGRDGEASRANRMALFEFATRWRREAQGTASFDRAAVIDAFAAQKTGGAQAAGAAQALDREMYADRKREERLSAVGFSTSGPLIARWEVGRVQAILLRSTAITVELHAPPPEVLRKLLRALKFHQLLHSVEPHESGRLAIRIDGTSSLFDATTKYGLRYAILVPAMIAAGASRILAEVKGRSAKTFLLEGEALLALKVEAERLAGEVPPREEVEDLLTRFPLLASRWTAQRGARLVDLAGITVCVPDLNFVRDDGLRVAFELLGFWSRKAVWDRVEAVERGLAEPVLFAVSERLRVSAEAMPSEAPSALYVFKGTLRPKLVLEHLERMAVACDARAASTITAKKPRKAKKIP